MLLSRFVCFSSRLIYLSFSLYIFLFTCICLFVCLLHSLLFLSCHLRHLVIKVAVDYEEDHAEDVHKEAANEEDELCGVDLVDKVNCVVDPGGVNPVLLCGVAVEVPAEQREVEGSLQPVPAHKKQPEHKSVYGVLGKDKGLEAPGKVCWRKVNVEVTVRNQLWHQTQTHKHNKQNIKVKTKQNNKMKQVTRTVRTTMKNRAMMAMTPTIHGNTPKRTPISLLSFCFFFFF